MKGLGQGVQSFKKGMNEPLAEEPEENGEEEKQESETEAEAGRTDTGTAAAK